MDLNHCTLSPEPRQAIWKQITVGVESEINPEVLYMEVQVTLHGILRDYLPRQAKGKTTLNLPAGATVAQVVAQLKLKQTITAAVNGVQVETSYVLQPGDDLQMFRMIGGGG